MSLSGKAALITGSTSGIGLGIAVALAKNGCDVVVTGSRSEAAAQDAVAKVKASSSQSRVVFKQCDLKDTSATEEFAKEVLQDFPNGIDILVNNAGMQYVSEVSKIPLDKWNDMMAVNITAPFIFSKYFVPKMKEKGWGRVVNISSVQAIIAHPNKTPYVTTKSGLTGFTRALAMETARHGITVNALCPAWTDTPLVLPQVEKVAREHNLSIEDAKVKLFTESTPTGQVNTPEQFGEIALFLCSEGAKNLTGTTIPVDGGMVIQ